jgi:phospholipid:diacylglycerol acyltransferase
MQTSSDEADLSHETVSPNLTMNDASNYVLLHTPPSFQRMIQQNYSYGFENDPIKLKENAKDHRKVSWNCILSTG